MNISRPKIERLTEAHLQRMNIGKRYWGSNLEDISSDSAHGRVVKKYLRQLDTMMTQGIGMYLWGDNSRGKTYTACAALKAIHQSGWSVYCVMADQLRSIYIDRSMFDPEMSVVQRVEQVEVLLMS